MGNDGGHRKAMRDRGLPGERSAQRLAAVLHLPQTESRRRLRLGDAIVMDREPHTAPAIVNLDTDLPRFRVAQHVGQGLL